MHTLNNKNNVHCELISKAEQLYQSGSCDAAVDLLLSGIKQYPGEKRLYYALAEMLIDSELYKDAFEILNQMPLNVKNPRKLELLGYCKFGLALFEEADTIVRQVLDDDPESAAALNLNGLLALQRSDKSTAEEFFHKALVANPEYGEPYTHLGRLSAENHNASEAIDYYEKGFQLAPTATLSALSYHSAVQAQNAYQRAEPIFKIALEQNPLNKRLAYLMIEIFLQQSKFDDAMQAIEKAIVSFGTGDGILEAALNIRERIGPLKIKGKGNTSWSVSLCMITKNEEKHLAKCLSSAKAIVDEIVVVDTGSGDRTPDVAAVFGASVHEFKWVDDYSKARNFSLSKAAGDWILILDADEVVSSRDYDHFREIINTQATTPAAFSIVTRNYTMQANTIGWTANEGQYDLEEAGAGWIHSQKVRLFKNDPRIRFEYPIHEIVDPCLQRLGIPIRKCNFVVHHYGKLNAGLKNRKSQAYYTIGRKKLDELGDNHVALRELAIQAGHLEEQDQAIELWQRYLKHAPDDPEAYINMGTAYFNLGRYDQAAVSARKAMALGPDMKEAHFNYAISELHLGDAHEAIAVLRGVLELYPRYPAAQFMLAAAYCCDGQKDMALTEFEKIRGTDVGPHLAVAFYDLAKRLSAANQKIYAVSVLETAVVSNMANDNILSLLNDIRQKN